MTTAHVLLPDRIRYRLRAASLAALILVAMVACGDSATDPVNTPLDGLARSSVADSVGNVPPAPQAAAAPGYFRGTVLGPSTPGAGNDSLSTAPRVAGAVVTAFPVVGGDDADPEIGDAAATATTGADGRFTLATLPGGTYVVTIAPPASSPYRGVWVTASAHAGSHEHPWWVVLQER